MHRKRQYVQSYLAQAATWMYPTYLGATTFEGLLCLPLLESQLWESRDLACLVLCFFPGTQNHSGAQVIFVKGMLSGYLNGSPQLLPCASSHPQCRKQSFTGPYSKTGRVPRTAPPVTAFPCASASGRAFPQASPGTSVSGRAFPQGSPCTSASQGQVSGSQRMEIHGSKLTKRSISYWLNARPQEPYCLDSDFSSVISTVQPL